METNVTNALHPGSNDHLQARFSPKETADYTELVAALQKTLIENTKKYGPALFYTKTRQKVSSEDGGAINVKLIQVYQQAYDEADRQRYKCACCSNFIHQFGSLVFVTPEGELRSAIWDTEQLSQESFFYPIVQRMQSIVQAGQITGVFLSTHKRWGTREAGGFSHLHVNPDHSLLAHHYPALTKQAGEINSDHAMLMHRFAQSSYTSPVILKLLRVLEPKVIDKQEVVEGPAKFLYETAKKLEATKNAMHKSNLLWRAAASTSKGLMHSDMADMLLGLIEKGWGFNALKQRFGKVTAADEYRRTQTPPADGAIDAAERFINDIGAQASLRRRLAVLEDFPERAIVWKPQPKQEEPAQEDTSIFGRLKKENKPAETPAQMSLPKTTMSWNKFLTDVLPAMQSLEIYVPGAEYFVGYATAVDPDSPPIFYYDREDDRIQMSWYMKIGGRDFNGKLQPVPAANWGLAPNRFTPVKAVVLSPHNWPGRDYEHQAAQTHFIIEGAYDALVVDHDVTGTALFPEILGQLWQEHGRVVEAYSNADKFEGKTKDQAAGLAIAQGYPTERLLRVTTELGTREIIIDRWE